MKVLRAATVACIAALSSGCYSPLVVRQERYYFADGDSRLVVARGRVVQGWTIRPSAGQAFVTIIYYPLDIVASSAVAIRCVFSNDLDVTVPWALASVVLPGVSLAWVGPPNNFQVEASFIETLLAAEARGLPLEYVSYLLGFEELFEVWTYEGEYPGELFSSAVAARPERWRKMKFGPRASRNPKWRHWGGAERTHNAVLKSEAYPPDWSRSR